MASTVARRYRDADTIQVQRAPAQPRDFASTLSATPAVATIIGRAAPSFSPPAQPVAEAATPPRPVARTVLPSPALARRGSAAYEAAASIGRSPAADADVSTPSASSLSIEC